MKHYWQACAIARALDVVGDRWSLLVRELTLGPRRYRDLAAGLPGAMRDRVTFSWLAPRVTVCIPFSLPVGLPYTWAASRPAW